MQGKKSEMQEKKEGKKEDKGPWRSLDPAVSFAAVLPYGKGEFAVGVVGLDRGEAGDKCHVKRTGRRPLNLPQTGTGYHAIP